MFMSPPELLAYEENADYLSLVDVPRLTEIAPIDLQLIESVLDCCKMNYNYHQGKRKGKTGEPTVAA